jgi:ribosomal protein S4E
LGGTYIKITDSRKIDEEEFERGGSWPVSEGTEIIDLARVLDVQINIIEIIKFTDEQLQSMELGKDAKFTGTIREINQVKNAKRAVVNMVLSQGQYNPLLSKEPLTQGRSVKEIKESLNVLIDKKS